MTQLDVLKVCCDTLIGILLLQERDLSQTLQPGRKVSNPTLRVLVLDTFTLRKTLSQVNGSTHVLGCQF